MATQIYARHAKDGQLIEHATDIRLRAEWTVGQLLTEMAESGEHEAGAGQKIKVACRDFEAFRASTKTESSRWQKNRRPP